MNIRVPKRSTSTTSRIAAMPDVIGIDYQPPLGLTEFSRDGGVDESYQEVGGGKSALARHISQYSSRPMRSRRI